MKALEKITILLIIVSSFLNLLDINGSLFFLSISLSLLMLLYLFGSWYLFKSKRLNLLTNLIFGIVYSFGIQAILYQAMNWNNCQVISIFSLVILGLLLILFTALKINMFKDHIYLYIRGLLIFLINLLLVI